MNAGELVGVIVVVAVAATVQLAAGFGFGLAAVPLLAVLLDPHDAVVVALGLATFTNSYQAWSGRHDADRAVLGRMIVGAFAGLPVGLAVFLAVDDAVLGLLIGVAVLAAVVVIAAGLDLRQAGPALDVAGGAMAGAFTMSTGVNGPPLVFVLQARHFPPDRFRGTITTVFATLDVVSIVVFAATGELRSTALLAIAVALPGLAVGALVGLWLRRHLDPARFRRLVLALLTVAGISAVVSALT
ncbi:MAG: sulfite exporter TauE/SafE family protein [Ilumatobacteraceae bacterium]